jgi:hypothetical protein
MRHALSAAALAFLLLATTSLGCVDSHNDEVSGSTFDAVGVVRPGPSPGGSPGPGETPNVDGSWLNSITITFNSCGSRVPPLGGTQVVDLSQSDAVLDAHVFSACGTPIATGVGSIHGSSLSLSFTREVEVTPNCTLRIQTVQSGSLQNGGDSLISGANRSTVFGMGNCGSGLPCEVRANLLMERCPPASCTSQNCP